MICETIDHSTALDSENKCTTNQLNEHRKEMDRLTQFSDIEKEKMSLEFAVNQFLSYKITGDAQSDYFSVVGFTFQALSHIGQLEKLGLDKLTIKGLVSPIYQQIGESPFFKRMQTWPRGYPGDFEMIEYILAGKNQCKPHTKEFHLENHGVSAAIAQQHCNKVVAQASKILEVAHRIENPRILSIACGSSPDIHSVAPYLKDNMEFVLLDGDKDALACSQMKLSSYNFSCQFIHGNILKKIVELRNHGHFDLVLIGGLFDYLKDSTIIKILNSLRENNLKKEGLIFFTNISEYNPARLWIEYLGDWELIHRSDAQLFDLALGAGFLKSECRIQKESTSLTYLVECMQP